MNLLLTSKGITNNSIKTAFLEMLGKEIKNTQIGFVTTGCYFATTADKSWFVEEMGSFYKLGAKNFELIEFNTLPREIILERMGNSDCLVLSGGSSAPLLHAIDRKNLREELRKFAQDKLYVGISASSHITAADLALSTQQKVNEYREKYGYNAGQALGWIDFYVRSHYRSENFPHITKQYVAGLAQKLGKRIYAIDDDSAVKVIDKQVEVVSEGVYERFV